MLVSLIVEKPSNWELNLVAKKKGRFRTWFCLEFQDDIRPLVVKMSLQVLVGDECGESIESMKLICLLSRVMSLRFKSREGGIVIS